MREESGITPYAELTAEWEPWFEEYRYGALYVFPPAPVRARVNALRQRYDPRSHAICDAHISLTVPLPQPLRPAHVVELITVLRTFPRFEIAWGPVHQYPGIAGVVLQIAPAGPLRQLVSTLEACACFRGAPTRRYLFSPHMTIAEFITLEESAQLVRDLAAGGLEGRFWCTEVVYAVPDATFHFTERACWPLGSTGDHRPAERLGAVSA